MCGGQILYIKCSDLMPSVLHFKPRLITESRSMLGEISVLAQCVLITVAALREDCSWKTRLWGFIRQGNSVDYYIKNSGRVNGLCIGVRA